MAMPYTELDVQMQKQALYAQEQAARKVYSVLGMGLNPTQQDGDLGFQQQVAQYANALGGGSPIAVVRSNNKVLLLLRP